MKENKHIVARVLCLFVCIGVLLLVFNPFTSAWDMMDVASDTPSYVAGWIKEFAVKDWLPKNPHPTSDEIEAEIQLILKH